MEERRFKESSFSCLSRASVVKRCLYNNESHLSVAGPFFENITERSSGSAGFIVAASSERLRGPTAKPLFVDGRRIPSQQGTTWIRGRCRLLQ